MLPAELEAVLLTRSGGNPLYAEEYVRMLADRGVLDEADGGRRLDRAAELPLPETVQGIIAARLDALRPPEKAMLQDAAVLGEVGWQGALAALAQAEPAALSDRLDALERRQLLRRQRHSRVAGERQYAFSHVLVRDVAYQQLPRTARADKHRRAAEWFQALSPDRAEDRADLLAHHYLTALQYAEATGQDTAGLTGPARLALREAAERASQLSAFTAAARWYAAALELWPADDPERPRLLLRLGGRACTASRPAARSSPAPGTGSWRWANRSRRPRPRCCSACSPSGRATTPGRGPTPSRRSRSSKDRPRPRPRPRRTPRPT